MAITAIMTITFIMAIAAITAITDMRAITASTGIRAIRVNTTTIVSKEMYVIKAIEAIQGIMSITDEAAIMVLWPWQLLWQLQPIYSKQ